MPGGDEVLRSEDLGSKATGWVWQFAILPSAPYRQ
jgi:hypothetical protein